MPGSTIHIMFAYNLDPCGSNAYFAGSIALDAVDDFHLKDKTHFRKMPDRIHRIAEFAKGLPQNDFNRGMITHLYLDWRWDRCELSRFIELYGDGWFKPYRADISRLSHHFVHKYGWCADIWQRIYNMPQSDYMPVPGASPDEVRNFIDFGYHSSKETRDYPKLFLPDEAECFLKMTALEYPRFLESIDRL